MHGVDWNELKPTAGVAIAEAMKDNQTLESLCLSKSLNCITGSNNLNHEVGLALEQMLLVNRHLTRLDVGNNISF